MATYYYSGTIDLNQVSVNDGWVDGDLIVINPNSTGVISDSINIAVQYRLSRNATLEITPNSTTNLLYIESSVSYFITSYDPNSKIIANGSLISLGNLIQGTTYLELDLSALPFVPHALYLEDEQEWYLCVNHPVFDYYATASQYFSDNEIQGFYYDDVNKKAIFQYKQPISGTTRVLHPQIIFNYNDFTSNSSFFSLSYSSEVLSILKGVYLYRNTSFDMRRASFEIYDSVIYSYILNANYLKLNNCSLYTSTAYSLYFRDSGKIILNECNVFSTVGIDNSNIECYNSKFHTVNGSALSGLSGINLGSAIMDSSIFYGKIINQNGIDFYFKNCEFTYGSNVNLANYWLSFTDKGTVVFEGCTFNVGGDTYYPIISASYIDKFAMSNCIFNISDRKPISSLAKENEIKGVKVNRTGATTSYYSTVEKGIYDLISYEDINLGYSDAELLIAKDHKVYTVDVFNNSVGFIEDTLANNFYVLCGYKKVYDFIMEYNSISNTTTSVLVAPNGYFIMKVPENQFKAIEEITSLIYPAISGLDVYLSKDYKNWIHYSSLTDTPLDFSNEEYANFYIKVINNTTSEYGIGRFQFSFTKRTNYLYDVNYYPYSLKLLNVKPHSEVRIYDITDPNNPIELFGIEDTGTNETDVEYRYKYLSQDLPIKIIVFNLDYNPVELTYTLTNKNNEIPVLQIKDKWYYNPV